MSFIPDKEKDGSSFQKPHAPPIRKLFTSINTEDSESNISENDTFRVFLRMKPNWEFNESNDCIKINNNVKLICKPPPTSKFKKLEKVEYTFSHIFGPKTTQYEIFSKCVVNCVEDLLLGYNSLIFAYGTTNAGKTFTVQGSAKSPGIIPQTLHTLFSNITVDKRVRYRPDKAKDFSKIESSTSQEELQATKDILRSFHSFKSKSSTLNNDSSQFMQVLQKSSIDLKNNKPTCSVWISFLEVYNETIYDLLVPATSSRKPLKLAVDKYDNFYVKELKQIHVSSAEEAFTIYQFGKRNLNVASTRLNEHSSRSHCIFTIHVINLDSDKQPITSKLCICDLAGTERQTKAQNTGQRLKESGNINGSLFQLNRCLRAIRENQMKHSNQLIPYRHSNLTKLLHSALDDRTDERIIMIVNINPSAELYDETQQVLKMCAIASKIKNKPITNKPQQSSRFTTLIYGRETASLEELSDYEEDLAEEADDYLEMHELKEKLMRQEEEINRLNEHVKFRENYHENTKKNLREYCEKIEKTYKNRVKSLEERLKSQKEYYVWKIADVKKNTFLESICDENVKENLMKKEAQIEELEKRLLELQCDDGCKNLSSSSCDEALKEELSKKDAIIEDLEKKVLELQCNDECKNLSSSVEIQEKEAEIKELKSLLEEAKEEYLFLEKKHKTDLIKIRELENELCDKNDIIENMDNALNAKQNAFEEQEQKIESLEEKLYQNTIENELTMNELERVRDMRLAEYTSEIEKLNLEVELLKQKISELTEEVDSLRREKNQLMEKVEENAKLKLDIEHLNKEIEKLVEEKVSECEKVQFRIKEMNNRIEKLIQERDEKLKEKDDENERLRFDIEAMTNKMEKLIQDRDERLKEIESENDKLKSEIEEWSRKSEDKITEKLNEQFERLMLEPEYSKTEETTKRYNTRRNNRTPCGKENRFFNKGTPVELGNKSTKKNRGKPKTPLSVLQDLDDSLETNVFRNIPEKVICTNDILKNVPTKEKKKLFSSSPPALSGHESTIVEPSKDRFKEMTTPAETVKLLKKRK